MTGAWLRLAMLAWALAAASSATAAAPADAPPARPLGQSQRARLARIQDLAATPTVESAKEIVQLGIRAASAEEPIRAAAIDALGGMAHDDGVARYLLKILEGELRRGSSPAAIPLTLVMLGAEPAPLAADVDALLEGQATASERGAAHLWNTITAAVQRGDGFAVRVLLRLASLPCFAKDLPFRRGVVGGLITMRRPEAVEALIGMLGRITGEARTDIVAYLVAISGERHGLDAAAWSAWWRDRPASFSLPTQPDMVGARLAGAAGADTYYDLPLYAERMVFVIDTSGSMEGGRLAAAQRELIKAIDGLPEATHFAVVSYSTKAHAWSRSLLPADETNKQAAMSFVARLEPAGLTASFDALDTAFAFDADAIYFLSDGAPTTGRIRDPAGILRFVVEANRRRGIAIYSIGIMPDGTLSEFLRQLAEGNFGAYRQVDR